MKYAYAALALAALVRAQTREDIPECAIPCLDDAVKSETSCSVDDYACICKDFDAIQGAATSCVIEECGADKALNEVLPATQALCENVGDGDDDSETTSASPAPTTSEEPQIPEESATETPAPTETFETSVTTVSTTATVTDCDTECTGSPGTTVAPTVPSAPTNGTGPAPTAPVPTAGAAAFGPVGGVFLAGLAALAL